MRILFALTLTASLLASPANPPGLLGQLQAFLASIWDEGCGADPNGCPKVALPDAGCGADPDGCPKVAVPDAGCGADPNGCPKGS